MAEIDFTAAAHDAAKEVLRQLDNIAVLSGGQLESAIALGWLAGYRDGSEAVLALAHEHFGQLSGTLTAEAPQAPTDLGGST